mgnify:FL=1
MTIASADGGPIRSANHIPIQPHCGIDRIRETDLLVIASATYIDQILERNPELIPWLRELYNKGAHIASICTGAFLLAESGLLDGKSATLHWGFAEMFRTRYPEIPVQQDRIYIDHGRLYCSAGVSAGMDLSLYLVEKFCGRKAAVASAKTMVLDMERQTQAPYDCFFAPKDHGDLRVVRIQERIEQQLTETIDYNRLADEFGMSRRSMERRFTNSVGMTPLAYLQKLRVEYAKHLLEEGTRSFSEITCQAGYEDVSFFRKLFVRLTGLRPREYRQRFARNS